MKQIVCGVYDSAIQSYGRPFYVRAQGEALRSFIDEVNRVSADNQLNQHPDDFELRCLGTFDDESGEFATLENGIYTLARGKDVVKS